MSTWISRVLWAGGAALALSACDMSDPLASLPDVRALTAVTPAAQVGSSRRALSRIDLAGGAITLAAPSGYCIDRRSVKRGLKSSFALMARCDSLGADGFFDEYDIALITVTIAPAGEQDTAPTADDLALLTDSGKVLETLTRNEVPMIRVSGTARLEGVDASHWRAAFVLNGQLVGLALYAPPASQSLRAAGAATLGELVGRTRRASAPD